VQQKKEPEGVSGFIVSQQQKQHWFRVELQNELPAGFSRVRAGLHRPDAS
jgi:hypothetical protein